MRSSLTLDGDKGHFVQVIGLELLEEGLLDLLDLGLALLVGEPLLAEALLLHLLLGRRLVLRVGADGIVRFLVHTLDLSRKHVVTNGFQTNV